MGLTWGLQEKCADYIASTGLFEPIFQEHKVRQYYLDLHLVIDTNSSMFLWQESLEHFKKSVQKSKAFNRIELFHLDSSDNQPKFLHRNLKRTIAYNSPLFKKQKTLTLVLTDVVGKAWRSNQMFFVLEEWLKGSFVTLVSMLPHTMWQKTPLRQGITLFMHNRRRDANNSKLEAEYEIETSQYPINIPVIPFDESAFGYLTNLLLAKRNSWIEARVFPRLPDYSSQTDNPIETVEAKKRVERFFASAYTDAKKLAIYCSVLPLNKTVIEEVIRIKNLGNTMNAFAEFYFGGLLDKTNDSKVVAYEFYHGVRQELMYHISVEEVKPLFYILDEVISRSLGLDGSLLDLLFGSSDNDEKLSPKEKELAELLIQILGHKGKFFDKEMEGLQTKIDTIHLKSNTYQMGSNKSSDEQPVHEITFDYNFAIAKYPVTFEEYDLYCEAKGIKKPDDRGWGRGKRPVIYVNWEDANAYCKWLNEQTGKNVSPKLTPPNFVLRANLRGF